MSPSPNTGTNSSPGAAPLPPLPDLNTSSDPQQGGGSQMAAVISGLAPIKMGVDSILAACKSIQQSGVIPGSEQVLGQIVALATSLLPMAAQQVLQPGGGSGGPIPPVGV